jgi:hypothetical protein
LFSVTPWRRRSTLIFLRQTMSLGNTAAAVLMLTIHGAQIASSCVNSIYLYVSTFRSMCAVPNMAVFCSLLLLLLILITYSLITSSFLPFFLPPSQPSFLPSFLTAVELPLGGSSPYTNTDKTSKNKYT